LHDYYTILCNNGYANPAFADELLLSLYINDIIEAYGAKIRLKPEKYGGNLNELYAAMDCLYGNSCIFPMPDNDYIELPIVEAAVDILTEQDDLSPLRLHNCTNDGLPI